jgi:hypothetical protein
MGGINHKARDGLSFTVPVVYLAQDVMMLMQANTLQGPLEGVCPENQDFFEP